MLFPRRAIKLNAKSSHHQLRYLSGVADTAFVIIGDYELIWLIFIIFLLTFLNAELLGKMLLERTVFISAPLRLDGRALFIVDVLIDWQKVRRGSACLVEALGTLARRISISGAAQGHVEEGAGAFRIVGQPSGGAHGHVTVARVVAGRFICVRHERAAVRVAVEKGTERRNRLILHLLLLVSGRRFDAPPFRRLLRDLDRRLALRVDYKLLLFGSPQDQGGLRVTLLCAVGAKKLVEVRSEVGKDTMR